MAKRSALPTVGRWCAAAVGAAAASYAAYVGVTWWRYGRPARSKNAPDGLLDLFMPDYEVVECHSIRVDAPADRALDVACHAALEDSPLIRAILRGRELVLGAPEEKRRLPAELLAQMKALGWGVLAEIPGREIVMGAVTQPWKADTVFRAIHPEAFEAFDEPGYVKIAWTLRADPIDDLTSTVRTETRVVTTDAAARSMFRWYWAFFSPGIALIRKAMLRQVKCAAEHPE